MRRALTLAALLPVLGATWLLFDGPQAGDATFPGRNGRIAYMDSCQPVDGDFSTQNVDIFSANSDGSDIQRLTDDLRNDYSPAWSPDGSRIAFAREQEDFSRQVWVVNSDGSDPQQLTNLAFADGPDWSPDGNRIVFIGPSALGGLDIYVMNSDGSNVQNLTNVPGGDDVALEPSWSPDGSRIAFQLSTRVTPPDIWLMDPDGSNRTNLTNSPDWELSPDWSPDSSQIVFVRQQVDPFQYVQLYAMDSEGAAQRKVSEQFIDRGDWSPDGVRILFQTAHNPVTGYGTFTMDHDGNDVQRVLPENSGFGAVWQPLPSGAVNSDSVVRTCPSASTGAPTASPHPATPSPVPIVRTPAALPNTGGEAPAFAPSGWILVAAGLSTFTAIVVGAMLVRSRSRQT